MKTYKESELKRYAAPISDTEDAKCQHAIHMVRDAMKELGWTSGGLIHRSDPATSNWMLSMNHRDQYGTKRSITIFVQGSYANKTNIPSASDVDVAVILENELGHFRMENGRTWFDNSSWRDALVLQRFKDEVLTALNTKFQSGVSRGNKSIKVSGNSYRVDADVIPCGRIEGVVRRGLEWQKVVGVRIQADDGAAIVNFPEHHIKNGVLKNQRTSTHFKKCVRILKSIRGDMEATGIKSAKEIGSFVIESLLWNVPDELYGSNDSTRVRIQRIRRWLSANLDDIWDFTEINGIKKLGDDDSSRVFTSICFIVDLEQFYHYEITES